MKPLGKVADSAVIGVDSDNVSTSPQWKNHRTDSSQVGRFLTIYLTSEGSDPTLWLPAPYKAGPNKGRWYSENLDGLQMVLDGNGIGTDVKIPLTLPNGQNAEGQEYWIRYKLKHGDNDFTVAKVVDEIDRYLITLNIDYKDNGEDKTTSFYVPGSVYNYLMGFDPSSNVVWVNNLKLEPPTEKPSDYEDDPFTRFFVRLYDMLETFETNPIEGDPWLVKSTTKIINRNTPWGYKGTNPFLDQLVLIKGIATPDVLEQDELYPTAVRVAMRNFL
ncbi:MAG: hypothetical protein GXO78_00280 [Calditrichaeota bacterium]|nr:hypothetical protein [Calditrichota bacterium]